MGRGAWASLFVSDITSLFNRKCWHRIVGLPLLTAAAASINGTNSEAAAACPVVRMNRHLAHGGTEF